MLSQNLFENQDQNRQGLPKALIGDERRLKQVLINLIKNAYKFTDRLGTIWISAGLRKWMEESYLVVHVRDNGVGIVAHELERLFSRFGKMQRTAKINSEGIGLGLTIVKRIVEEHGGSISVFSEGEHKGSLFCFCIKCPVADSVLSLPLNI